MASSTAIPDKILCVTCRKGKGTFKCEGCSQTFCPKHSIDHRHQLSKDLEDIEVMRDLMQQTLNQGTKEPTEHPLMQKIDQWERESIAKVRQAAEEARKSLLKDAVKHIVTVQQKLQHLTDQLRQGREDDDFIETDISRWMKTLEEFRKELTDPVNITVREDSKPFVSKIHVNCEETSDIFERTCGQARIEESGKLVSKDQHGYTEVRGKSEYTTGRHVFRFRIEQLPDIGWIFLGVISKSTPMQERSYGSASSYGLSNKNQIFIAGIHGAPQGSDAIQNDIVQLTLDCDLQWIQLMNERTKSALQLPIDINKCPFPWQFHLNLFNVPTRVRILSSSE